MYKGFQVGYGGNGFTLGIMAGLSEAQVKFRMNIVKLAPLALLCLLEAFGPAQQNPPENSTPTQSQPDVIDILTGPTEQSSTPSAAPAEPEIRIPNFTSCSISELKKIIPDLAHLKPSQDQSHLTAILDKIGATTIDIARKTPNLISDEQIISQNGVMRTRQNFSFLVLQHLSKSNAIVLDEFRVDTKTGEKFQTENIVQAQTAGSGSSALELPPSRSILNSGGAPSTQGFFSQWLSFYPSNRRQAEFRYLGEQKTKGHRTLVVAFAQKPGSVPIPATVEYHEKRHRFFMQGVAWVDAADFRILRLWTDILAAPPGVPLRKFSTDAHFAEARIAEIAYALWLPRQIVVDWNIAGSTQRNTHTYSNYRLFRAKSKLVLNP